MSLLTSEKIKPVTHPAFSPDLPPSYFPKNQICDGGLTFTRLLATPLTAGTKETTTHQPRPRRVRVYYKIATVFQNKYKFSAKDVDNLDETGISTIQRPTKVIAPKSIRRLGTIGGANTTG
ncbi:hypothetical protein EVAR_96827_1 [Eumeta japonica]|uniref:Histone-lysine N-methyltransferase SETMAR n=1 Tax=Eumeta variegata TaxID=151549 RepID=A0A4C1WA21_EUMVA|nr:hypothetical protein EVAR_96827_1 [Eumeta japonica]